MNNKLKTAAVDQLFDAILCLENKEECYNFFEDLCTVNELLALSQRFASRVALVPAMAMSRISAAFTCRMALPSYASTGRNFTNSPTLISGLLSEIFSRQL